MTLAAPRDTNCWGKRDEACCPARRTRDHRLDHSLDEISDSCREAETNIMVATAAKAVSRLVTESKNVETD